MIKNYLKYFGILLLSIIIPIFILTIFNYFKIFSNNIIDTLKLIITLTSILINSFYLGKNSKSKGYIEGLKFGSLFIIFITLLNLILVNEFSLKILIYYLLIIITSMVGSTIGINKKNDAN